jgi:hypothetical protein
MPRDSVKSLAALAMCCVLLTHSRAHFAHLVVLVLLASQLAGLLACSLRSACCLSLLGVSNAPRDETGALIDVPLPKLSQAGGGKARPAA